ncbi:SDR family NAD(P)-dependent oxidoreductase [Microbacterium sp. Marseille-Q6648]|uniref:SDR family NAD(P)-dependent oxidoreductase n=1 Tax=Microbacterium sp. Marseille-Q6648 TaxID=2937991 RepID=UPI00203EF9BE|nr:SDR family NAD(P)-dependent oxidoreductase [Microbacterium sp. Marseille-Q6648]
MPRTALITGASSGLGAEFARQLAAQGADLVLVARDEAALHELGGRLTAEHGIRHEVIVADLADPAQTARVAQRLRDAERPVGILVNNAGFGLPLDFAGNDIDDEVRHLTVHVEATMRLMHAALDAMLARGNGRIVNVASVAAFLPRGTYGAAKRWVLDVSRWANVAYRDRGVTVTAVCPGFTHTDFHARMGLAAGREGVPGPLWLDAPFVVSSALRDVARGRAVSVPSVRYRLLTGLAGLLPDRILVAAGGTGR